MLDIIIIIIIIIDVQYLPEDDPDRSKHVGVMTNSVYTIQF
jgi:hypothetical protein